MAHDPGDFDEDDIFPDHDLDHDDDERRPKTRGPGAFATGSSVKSAGAVSESDSGG